MTALGYAVRAGRAARRDAPEAPRAPLLARVGRLAARAGLLGPDDAARGAGIVSAALGCLVGWTASAGWRAAAAVPLGALAGWRAGVAHADRARRASLRDARRALPGVLDRLAVCVLAGMSVDAALRTVRPGTPAALGAAIGEALSALDVGVPRARAYALLAERSGLDEVRALVASLARAERFGTSVSDTLVQQARELRSRARAAAEAEARTAPIKLLFPLVFCFLPAFVLLTIAPVALAALRTIGGL